MRPNFGLLVAVFSDVASRRPERAFRCGELSAQVALNFSLELLVEKKRAVGKLEVGARAREFSLSISCLRFEFCIDYPRSQPASAFLGKSPKSQRDARDVF